MHKRILLKISGEALLSKDKIHIHDVAAMDRICHDIKDAYSLGCEIAIVVGGGNICRGATISSIGIERSQADYMGMLATVINAIALRSKLENLGLDVRVQSAIEMGAICERYITSKCIKHMQKGRIVILAAGTGNPFFTTDTAGVLRAIETKCSIMLKATQVDGVYCSDPKTNINALKYKALTYDEAIFNNLKVLDGAAITLAKENNMPILVFDINAKNGLSMVLNGNGEYSIIQ